MQDLAVRSYLSSVPAGTWGPSRRAVSSSAAAAFYGPGLRLPAALNPHSVRQSCSDGPPSAWWLLFHPSGSKENVFLESLSLIVFPVGFLPGIPQFQPSAHFHFNCIFMMPQNTPPLKSLENYSSICRDLLDMATQFSYDVFHFSLSAIYSGTFPQDLSPLAFLPQMPFYF